MLRTPWISGLAIALLCVAGAQAQETTGKEAVSREPQAESAAAARVASPAMSVQVSQYWLGIHCRPAGDLLRSQFGIAEDRGLVVNLVVPDSPAAAAQIHRHDILLTADDKPLCEIVDVIEAVKSAEGKELKLGVIRAGKRETIIVKPSKRPQHIVSAVPRKKGEEKADWDKIQKWLQKVEPGELGDGTRSFRFVRPGTILPPAAGTKPAMPGNLRVTITKQSNQPATINVQRGQDKWTVTEDDLAKLPADIRPHIEQLLGQGSRKLIGRMDFTAPGHGHEKLEARMDEMLKRIDRLHEMIEELSKQQSKQAPSEAATPE